MIETSGLRVLSLSLGRGLAAAGASGTDAARRQVEYGSHFAEYVILARTPNAPDIYGPRCLSDTVRVMPTLSSGNPLALLRMMQMGERILGEHRFHVITAQEPFVTGSAGLWLRRRFVLPLQIQLHGDFIDNPYWLGEKPINRLLNPLGKYVLSRADTVRTVNQSNRLWVMERFGLPPERVTCSPVGADMALFGNARGDRVRAEYAERGFRHLVLFVGSLVKNKDAVTLLRMFAQVVEQYSQTCLALAGDGRERPALEAMAARLRIAHVVDFVGFLPLQAVAEYMAAANVVVLSSHVEGFGRVLVEAGAAGRPCVATLCPGPRDILRDGETGYLVPIGDAATMAEKVLYLLRNPGRADAMGTRARERVLARYDPHRLVKENIESLRRTAELGLRKESR